MGDQAPKWGTAVDTPEKAYPIAWYECDEDVRVVEGQDENGFDKVIFTGPKWLRCMDCRSLRTRGGMQLNGGRCEECGARRCRGAYKLTEDEKDNLRWGIYPLLDWEYELIHGKPRGSNG